MTGNYGRGKYGGISPKPPIFPVILLPVTSAVCLAKFFLNIKIIYSFLSVLDTFASTMIDDDI